MENSGFYPGPRRLSSRCRARSSPSSTLIPRLRKNKHCTSYWVGTHLLHPKRVYFCILSTRFECIFTSSPLVSSVILGSYQASVGDVCSVYYARMRRHVYVTPKYAKPHSKRVEKMQNYTRNEWRRCQTTLETSGEDVKLHSKPVEKMSNYT